MIPVGTLCLIRDTHPLAGRCCTTVGVLQEERWINPAGERRSGLAYKITVPSEEIGWVARHHDLVPIAPPGRTERETKREPVHIGDLG